MKAIVLENIKQPLVYRDTALPAAQNGQVQVKLACAAINHRDLWISKGQYAGIQTPIILGSDGAGHCNGEEVLINPATKWGNNERVQSQAFEILGLPNQGTFAEYILVEANQVVKKPGHLSLAEAAALPLAGLTAYRALFTRAQIVPSDTVLITGIGGGVATLALQFALANGNPCFVSSSDPKKIQAAIAMGAQGGVLYTDSDWQKQLKAISGGIDVVIDGSAGAGFAKMLSIANPGARFAIYGGTAGPIQELNPQQLFWKQISIFGSTMGSDLDFEAMIAFVNQHMIVPMVSAVYPLNQANEAFKYVEAGKQMGKVVLEIG